MRDSKNNERKLSNSEYSYFISDGQGSIILHLDDEGNNYTNNPSWYRYDAYGQSLTGSSSSNQFRYRGEFCDNETGFIYLRGRYYNPDTGSFISEDPVKDGSNWYAYCGCDPVNFVDPSGYELMPDNYENTSEDDLKIMLDALNEQTDYTIFIDNDGYFDYDENEVLTEIKHEAGNELIKSLIDSTENCYSLKYDPNTAASFNPDNLTITFGQITKYKCVGIDKPIMVNTTISDGLQHELVHAYRYEVGVHIPNDNISEEMQTVGLWKTENWNGHMIITENILRYENGKLLRLKYAEVKK